MMSNCDILSVTHTIILVTFVRVTGDLGLYVQERQNQSNMQMINHPTSRYVSQRLFKGIFYATGVLKAGCTLHQ